MDKQNTKTILVMAGGTGGHVFPGLAVAEKLIAQHINVEWLGTKQGIESRVVPSADIPLHYLPVSGIRGKGMLGLPKAMFNLLLAQIKAIQLLKKIKPVSVLGMGGFVAGPGGLAARLLGIPLYVHEQNAIAGTTNKILSKFATKVMQGFPLAFENIDVETVGNPVRHSIVELGMSLASKPRKALADKRLNVLVVGGSLGAQAINRIVPNAFHKFNESERPNIRHQTGKAQAEQIENVYKQLHVDAQVLPFIEDMKDAYEWADLVVCRAGALTVSEISVVGLPAIYIPLPSAIDDHQTANAKIVETANAGVLLAQADMTEIKLHALVSQLIGNESALETMAKNSRNMALPFAADKVAEICLGKCK